MSHPQEFIFAQMLIQARKQAGLSQAELAEKSGCQIGHIENETRLPSYETIVKLCLTLGVSADYLIFGRTENAQVQRRAMLFEQVIRMVAKEIQYTEEPS